MSFKIVRADEALVKENLFITLFGQPGVGKTTLSFTAPSPLHLDFDQGITRAVPKRRPDSIQFKAYGQFYDWLMSDEAMIEVEAAGYQSVILDTIGTMLEDYVTPWLISQNPRNGNNTGGLSLPGWGALSTHFMTVRSRLYTVGFRHIIAITHEKEEGDGDLKQLRLAVKGGTSDIITRSSDMIGYMHVKGQKTVVDFQPSQMHIGKNSAGLPIIEIPNAATPAYDTYLADKVITACLDRMKEGSEAQVAANTRLNEYREMLAECSKPADFDALIATIADEPSKAIQLQIRGLLATALKTAGMVYSKEAGKVIKAKAEKGAATEKEVENEA